MQTDLDLKDISSCTTGSAATHAHSACRTTRAMWYEEQQVLIWYLRLQALKSLVQIVTGGSRYTETAPCPYQKVHNFRMSCSPSEFQYSHHTNGEESGFFMCLEIIKPSMSVDLSLAA